MYQTPIFNKSLSRKTSSASLQAAFSIEQQDIEQAQRFRFEIFSKEFNATLNSNGLDADSFDSHCHHLLVRDSSTQQLVGYTRILTQDQNQNQNQFYSSNEFNLEQLSLLPGSVMEIGRTCIHPDYRNGATLGVLWTAIAKFLLNNNVDYLIGCASVAMNDGSAAVHQLNNHLQKKYRSSLITTTPKRQLPTSKQAELSDINMNLPSLLAAYLRMGAKVCGDPCWDPEFNCADMFILLNVDDLPRRYAKRFLSAA